MGDGGLRRKLAIHGPIVELNCTVAALNPLLDVALGEFAVSGWPSRYVPISGIIQPYNAEEIAQRLPCSAAPSRISADAVEYHDQGRSWLVDNRFGAVELTPARQQFRAWVMPSPRMDALSLIEAVFYSPLRELLRRHGVHCLPGISVVRDGFAMLMVGSHSMEAELTAMISAGYRVIGQRHTALRAEDGRIALLHLPGGIPIHCLAGPHEKSDAFKPWIDLTEDHPGSRQNHAFCDAVVFVEPERAHRAVLSPLTSSEVLDRLDDAWPMDDAVGSIEHLVAELAGQVSGFTLRLSRNCRELLGLLNSVSSAGQFAQRHAVAA